MRRGLIVTGDDFGLAVPVNEAIEQAHVDGVLTTASLMVGEAAATDAVVRARRRPTLRVGLHVVVAGGRPVLPAGRLPALVDRHGRLPEDLFRAGVRFLGDAARSELRAEIHAQFEAFRATGLELDHANAHDHMHLHPVVGRILVEVGAEFGLRAVRVPEEPPSGERRRAIAERARRLGLRPWISILRRRLRRHGMASNDHVFGIEDSGRMNAETLLRILDDLPCGTSEVYLHPATRRAPELERTMADYDHRGELAALLDPRVRRRIERHGIALVSFRDLAAAHPDPAPRKELP